ncbi:uncharacterized protein LOC134787463 [Penaeus indicus]|uniref:uncharacterized protein LOC134787463 n=1 Tax=Penaeus indicus TaxID=29960 RepID=UPI00300C5352
MVIEKNREHGNDILLCFIDYKKAFDMVSHEVMWETMLEMGFARHLVDLIRSMYEHQRAAVKTTHGLTDWFDIGQVKQACVKVNDETIENVSSFVYLGALFKDNYDDSKEVKRRLATAKNAMVSLSNIWKDKAISISTKKRLLQSLVFPIATYGSEWHILRSDHLEKDLLTGSVYGKRRKGRPKTRLSDNIRHISGMSFVAMFRLAQDRAKWRATAVHS